MFISGLLLGSWRCFPYQRKIDANRAAVMAQFPEASQTITHQGRTMHYVRTGFGKPLVVFVHGSPGSWEAFASFMVDGELTQNLTLISVDRLGFGDSEPERVETSLAQQSLLIGQIISKEQHRTGAKNVILVGHSFGGPIIAKIASERGNGITSLVFVAAAVDPELEKVTWYQHTANWKIVRWLLPRAIDNANQEILPLRSELELLLPQWKDIRSPAVVLHGDDDALVSPANAEFIRRQLAHLPLEIHYLKKMGHFIPWERPEAIKNVILAEVERLQRTEPNL
jgi:pimeloyl-ACP methyl ester carboxylesterase